MIPVVVLVVAKAPVPGQAKTRLAAGVGDQAAADIAAAALLDTLDAVAAAPVAERVVALTGELDAAERADEIRARLADFTVVPQRGADFAARLANAHVDAAAAAGGLPVLQIGMDTPQVTAELIARMRAGTTRRRRGARARTGRRLVGARRDRCRDGRLPARDSNVAIRHRRCNAGGTWRHWCKCESGSHAGGCGHRR